jgi:3-phosphoshikimate 1-carboxyvinyltransferase/cytidylate kinase
VAEINKLDAFSLSSVDQLTGTFTVPGDKSISHRSIIFGALAEGQTRIKGFLRSEDCLATLNIMRQLGVAIEDDGHEIIVNGVGLHGLQAAADALDCGNAGTAMRLLAGLLAAQQFESTLVGDESLSTRPMGRVIKPLTKMGAKIASNDLKAPLKFSVSEHLSAIEYQSPIASAQVKSAVLIAGLYADGVTSVTEPNKSRDHTETMLQGFGCDVTVDGLTVCVKGKPKMKGQTIEVPADVSSAAFFMVLGLCHPNADFIISNVNINPTRDGVIKILQQMGGKLTLLNQRDQAGEPVADVRVQSSELKGIEFPQDLIPSAIDEFPVLSSGLVDGHGDHRCAMSFLLAGVLSQGEEIAVKGCHNIGTSFPEFFDLVKSLGIDVNQPVPVIAVDGPSGVGKGTISALLARELGWHLLDSGAIYRSLALKAMKEGVLATDEPRLIGLAQNLNLQFSVDNGKAIQILLDGEVVNEDLRSESCGEMASKIAPIPAVRAALMQRQKDFKQAPGLVADGRDMGTVVFKTAPLKVFLTASAEERAKRRYKQLKEQGVDVKIRDLLEDIEARDFRDSSRKVAPLVPAEDAHIIDTSDLSIDEVLAHVINLVEQYIKI